MLSLSDFILLKMVFDPVLYEAVMNLDSNQVVDRLRTHYAYELEHGFVTDESLESVEIVAIKQQYEEESKTDDYQWAL